MIFFPNNTFEFKSNNINLETEGNIENSVFDTDYKEGSYKTPFRKS